MNHPQALPAALNLASMRYPTELLAHVANRTPITNQVAETDGGCGFCARSHKKGDLVTSFEPGRTFNDMFSMLDKTSTVLCGYCESTRISFFQTHRPKLVVCAEGMFSFASNQDINYWLTNPPEGPYLMYYGNRKSQHIAWKASVNLSKEIMFVQFGNTVLTIRHEAMLRQKEAALRLAAAVNQARDSSAKSTSIKTPYVNPVRNLDDPIFGVIRREVLELVQQTPDLAADLELLHAATPGEVWAMAATLYAEPQARPEPISPQMVEDSLTRRADADIV